MLPAFKGALIEANRNPAAPQPDCIDAADIFTDYEVVPEPWEALELCLACPLNKLCLQNAKRVKPAWGVLGGIAWIDGKPTVDLRTYSLDTPDRDV